MLVLNFLDAHFDAPLFALTGGGYYSMLREVQASGIVGGAVYDALIGVTAREAGAMLVSLDRRAARTYDAVDVEHQFLI